MNDVDERRGGPLDPPRLLPPLPEAPGAAGGWLTAPPPEPPWLVGLWGASCFYCKKGLTDLVPLAARHRVPFVALHVPEFPHDADPGAPERALEEIGLPVGSAGVAHFRDATAWAELVAMRHWPTFLVVDRERRATFVLIGWAGSKDRMYEGLEAALVRVAAS
jgi:hypothetical protein